MLKLGTFVACHPVCVCWWLIGWCHHRSSVYCRLWTAALCVWVCACVCVHCDVWACVCVSVHCDVCVCVCGCVRVYIVMCVCGCVRVYIVMCVLNCVTFIVDDGNFQLSFDRPIFSGDCTASGWICQKASERENTEELKQVFCKGWMLLLTPNKQCLSTEWLSLLLLRHFYFGH